MPLRITKSWIGDLIFLGVVAFLGVWLLMNVVGASSFGRGSSGGGTLALAILFLIGLVAAVPVFVRWLSSDSLVEMDAENVTFFVGWQRRERCLIPRAKLLLVSVQKHRDEPVLSLLFDVGGVQPLRRFKWTPYLEIRSQEVLIEPGHVRGSLEQIAETWNRALQATNQAIASREGAKGAKG